MRLPRLTLLAACLLAPLLAPLAAPPAAQARTTIGSVNTNFRWPGPDDKIVVERYDDPAIKGVSCYVFNPDKARKHKLVLAHRRGIVIGAFRPTEWSPSTKANFPWFTGGDHRWGFEGKPAEHAVAGLYVQKRVPGEYRAKGAANPVRFVEPKGTTAPPSGGAWSTLWTRPPS